MRPEEDASLTGGGDCFSHWHSFDRTPTQDFLHGLQSAAKQSTYSADTVLRLEQDFVLVDTFASNVTITLPKAINGVEIEIMKVSPNYMLTIVPSGADTILLTTGVTLSTGNSALRLKAIGTDWRPI